MNERPGADDFDAALRARRRLVPRFEEPMDEQPSPELDRLVLGRARDALRRELPTERHFRGPRWGVPIALAATVLLSFGVVTQMDPTRNDAVLSQPESASRPVPEPQSTSPPQSDATPQAANDTDTDAAYRASAESDLAAAKSSADEAAGNVTAARVAAAPLAAAPLAAAPSAPVVEADGAATAGAAPTPPTPPTPSAPPAPPAPAPATPATSPPAMAAEVAGEARGIAADSAARESIRSRAATSAAQSFGKSASDTASTALTRDDPQRWLEGIERLRRAGELDAARRELAAFVEQHPELPLPATLQSLR